VSCGGIHAGRAAALELGLAFVAVVGAEAESGTAVTIAPEPSSRRESKRKRRKGRKDFSKDERITRYPEEQEALAGSTLRVFAIGNQHLTGPEMAAYYVTNIHRIVQRARKPRPFVDVVYLDSVDRRWPKQTRP